MQTLVAVVVFGCGTACAEGWVNEARAIGGRGGLQVAGAAVLLSVPTAAAVGVIDRVESYPEWALMDG